MNLKICEGTTLEKLVGLLSQRNAPSYKERQPLGCRRVQRYFSWNIENILKLHKTSFPHLALVHCGHQPIPRFFSLVVFFLISRLASQFLSIFTSFDGFKNKFQQWLWQTLKQEVLWVGSAGLLLPALLLAAALQSALSLSTVAAAAAAHPSYPIRPYYPPPPPTR